MTNRWSVGALSLLAFVLAVSAGCGGRGEQQVAERGGPVRIALVALNGGEGSGVTGEASFRKAGNDRVRVIVDIDGLSGSRHAVHVHVRGCDRDGSAVKHELADLVKGSSETVVNGSVQGHVGGGRSIGVHRTAEPTSGHVACGDLRTATFRRY